MPPDRKRDSQKAKGMTVSAKEVTAQGADGSGNYHERTIQVSDYEFVPVPDPALLRQLEELVPGAAEKYLNMGFREQEHRHSMEVKDFESNEKDRAASRREIRRGQYLGGVVAVATLSLCAVMAYFGSHVAASIFGIGGLIGLVRLFLTVPVSETKKETPPSSTPAETPEKPKLGDGKKK